jgi:hypothetical protein
VSPGDGSADCMDSCFTNEGSFGGSGSETSDFPVSPGDREAIISEEAGGIVCTAYKAHEHSEDESNYPTILFHFVTCKRLLHMQLLSNRERLLS